MTTDTATGSLALLGLPQDDNSTFLRGPRLGPDAIRHAIMCDSANMFAETGCDLGAPGLWHDAGDVALEQLSGVDAYNAIHDRVSRLLEEGHRVFSLGGDHSVSYPAVMAHAGHHSGLNLLHIDAHPDLYDDMGGNPFSHASPLARLMESGKVARLVQVGIRTLNAHQRAQAERFDVEVHEVRHGLNISKLRFDGPVYLTLDLDALDPAFAPGVSHHEPGGLSTREVLTIIQEFLGRLVGADLVELNPDRDINGVSAMVAAKLAKEIVARLIATA